MIDILNTIFIGVTFLVVWFHTEAFVEYCNLFNLKRLFKIGEFEKAQESDFSLEYLSWLKQTYPNFFTKLVNCPWCIGFWFTLLSSWIFSTFYIFPVIYVFTLVIYLLIVNKFFR
jgi:hypothetical protein